jgi:peptidyl-prolyl cis-trans isomerase C
VSNVRRHTLLAAILVVVVAVSVFVILDEPPPSPPFITPPEPANTPDLSFLPDPVAVVDSVPVPAADVRKVVIPLVNANAEPDTEVPAEVLLELCKRVTNEIIDRKLLYEEAVRLGIAPDPEAAEAELQRSELQFGGPRSFERILVQQGVTREDAFRKIVEDSVIERWQDAYVRKDLEVTPEEARVFYDEHPELFSRPEQVAATNIVILVEQDATPEEEAEARERITALRRRLEQGEDFYDLAREASQAPSRSRGGRIRPFARGERPPEFEAAAFSLDVGEISGIVQSPVGFHLIRLEERIPSETKAFDQIRNDLRLMLVDARIQERIQETLQRLRSDAKVEVFVPDQVPEPTPPPPPSPPPVDTTADGRDTFPENR